MLRCKAVQDIIYCIDVYPVHIILCCISSFVAYQPLLHINLVVVPIEALAK